jgi:hypothetical protein
MFDSGCIKDIAFSLELGIPGLVSKKRMVEFYASSEILAITLAWVLLPGLPLILWLEEFFLRNC